MYVRNENIDIQNMSFLHLIYLFLINTVYVNYGHEEILTFWHIQLVYY